MGLLGAIFLILLISSILIGILYFKDRRTNKDEKNEDEKPDESESDSGEVEEDRGKSEPIRLPPVREMKEVTKTIESRVDGRSERVEGKFDQSKIPRFKEFGFFDGRESYAPSSDQFKPSDMMRGVVGIGSGTMKSSDNPEMGLMKRGTDDREELNKLVFARRTPLFEEMNGNKGNVEK